ncbi:glycosyltransferase family 4 protein [Vibrio mediterranei]|uniref:glycosyltransferase family 4 protein n=1 Tax=Vibrio mediterranei TaxID=689 RepID=UPI0040688FC8
MKKILHVFRNLKYGGNQALALNLIKYSSVDFEHHILSLHDDLEMNKEFQDLGCSITVIPHKETNFNSFKLKFEEFVLENGFNTIVTWFYPYVLRLDVPGVRFVHHVGTAPLKRPVLNWVKSLLIIKFSKLRRENHHFVFASNYVLEKNASTYFHHFDNSQVILNGIDNVRFEKTCQTQRESSQNFVITMIGRLDGSKDFDTLINIIPQLNISNLKVNIVGDGIDRSRLECLAETLNVGNKINFMGRRSDIPDILRESDLFVFLNKPLEGFGLVIVEAMSSSIPVVTYNLGANSEIIDNNKDGYLVSNQAELIEKIRFLEEDRDALSEIGKLARAKAVSCFEVKDMVKKYEELY